MTEIEISPLNDDLSLRAHAVLPGGHFGNMASDVIIARGKEGRIWDNRGNEYVDFLLGSGPMFVGHAHPKVTEAVLNQVPNGTTFFANNMTLQDPALHGSAEATPTLLSLTLYLFLV